MSERIHVLAQQIFGKSSVDDCDLQEIKDLAGRYPYFAPVQFLLLEKLKKENSPEYTTQLQKAVLYYHNPLEFDYFISSDRFETEVDFTESDQPSIIEPEQEEKSFDTTEIPEEETANTNENVMESSAEEKMAESIERVLEKEEEQIKEPEPNSNNNALVFEPYHTVDYFASQGIKLSHEEVSKDKFSKQLKSFTEWLKTMKRLPASEIPSNIDAGFESNVQHLAEGSVHDANVFTEAMAEVWIKQGNKEKAIETFHKLGLLNPSKKAYFAGLIENLKNS